MCGLKQYQKIEKFSTGGLLCFCLVFFNLLSFSVSAACDRWSEGGLQSVKWVTDGDTLQLASGEKIRLIGINTPELARKQRPAEHYAKRAKVRLKSLVATSGSKLYLKYGRESQDRHRRTLAHIYNKNGKNLIELLLKEGFGYAIFFPPNLQNIDCYQQAEAFARGKKLGVWHNRQRVRAVDLPRDRGGFHLLQGVIKRVGKSKRALWLNLKGNVALRIDWLDMEWFPNLEIDSLKGRRVEVRGWIYRRKGEQRIRLRHQADLRLLP
jgi:micrococcal nuclease